MPLGVRAKRKGRAMQYSEWLNLCAMYAGSEWEEFYPKYKFLGGYNKGMTPQQAITYCRRVKLLDKLEPIVVAA